MKPRDYCCCAIPLVNPGIYAALTEQLVLGITAGVLAVATDDIVGAATPSVAKWIFAIVCFVGAGIQFLGFLGVSSEKAGLFRRYAQLNSIATLAAFAVAAVWIIISATRHDTAQKNCEKQFFPQDQSGETSSQGQTMCNIFPWVDVGIMGGLWVVLAITQMYLLVAVSSYSSGQRADHKRIDDEYDPANPLTMGGSDIPMQSRSDPWDSRPSTDTITDDRDGAGDRYGHLRQQSNASVATTLGEKVQQPAQHGHYGGGYGGAPAQPSYTYTQEPEPTPYHQDQFYSGASTGGVGQPERSLPHPGQSPP